MTQDFEKRIFEPPGISTALLEAARSLRGNMTHAEQALWHCIRRRQLGGFRFRRQHPCERFILDFYCCEVKLAVELDGGQHNTPEGIARDKVRHEILQEQGIQVIRFWNNEVFTNLEGVLQRILKELTKRKLHSEGT